MKLHPVSFLQCTWGQQSINRPKRVTIRSCLSIINSISKSNFKSWATFCSWQYRWGSWRTVFFVSCACRFHTLLGIVRHYNQCYIFNDQLSQTDRNAILLNSNVYRMCSVFFNKLITKINYAPQGRWGKLATVKDSKTDVSSVSSSSQWIRE